MTQGDPIRMNPGTCPGPTGKRHSLFSSDFQTKVVGQLVKAERENGVHMQRAEARDKGGLDSADNEPLMRLCPKLES